MALDCNTTDHANSSLLGNAHKNSMIREKKLWAAMVIKMSPYVFPHNVMQLILFYYFNVSYVDIWVSPFTLHSTAHGLLLSTLLNINTHMLLQFRFNSLVNQWGQGNSIVHVNKRSNLIPLSDPRKIMVDSEFDLNIWYIPLCCYIFLPLMRTRNW